jgi:hypothetical protein
MMVFQHRDGGLLVGNPQGDSSREVSDLFVRGFAAAAAAVVFFVIAIIAINCQSIAIITNT